MKRAVIALALVFAFTSFLACGDDGLTKQEAQQVNAVVFGVAQSVRSNVESGVQQQPGKADAVVVGDYTYEWDGENYSFSGSATGPEGGSASVSGSGSVAGQSVNFNCDMSFSAYGAQGYVLDGDLHMSAVVENAYVKFEYSGAIDVSGEVVGSLDFDLLVEVDGTTGDVKYEGTVGGHSMSVDVNYNDYL